MPKLKLFNPQTERQCEDAVQFYWWLGSGLECLSWSLVELRAALRSLRMALKAFREAAERYRWYREHKRINL